MINAWMDKAFLLYELKVFLQFLQDPVRRQYNFIEHNICFVFASKKGDDPCAPCPLLVDNKCIMKTSPLYQTAHNAYDPRREEVGRRKSAPMIKNLYFQNRIRRPFANLSKMIGLMISEIESIDGDVLPDGFMVELSKKVSELSNTIVNEVVY